jgi:hypothetical protein
LQIKQKRAFFVYFSITTKHRHVRTFLSSTADAEMRRYEPRRSENCASLVIESASSRMISFTPWLQRFDTQGRTLEIRMIFFPGRDRYVTNAPEELLGAGELLDLVADDVNAAVVRCVKLFIQSAAQPR